MSFNGNQYTSDAGLELTTKGQIHTYSTENAAIDVGTNTYVLQADSSTATGLAWSDPENLKHAVFMQVAASDETTPLTVADDKVTFRIPEAITLNAGIEGVRASLTAKGTTSGVTTIDIEMGGVSILSTLLTIDYDEFTSYTAATPVVVGTTALTKNAVMTVNVDGLSGGATESGLKIQLIGDLT